MRKYLVGIAILAICAGLLAIGMLRFPLWLRVLGFFLGALYLIGGSAYLAIRYFKGDRMRGTQLGLYPRIWQRWILDEPDEASARRR